jgi:hypothetical protein
LQSIVNIQSQVCAKRIQMVEGAWTCSENKQLENLSDKIIKVGIEDLCCHLSNPINTKHLSILSLCHHFNSIWAQINNPNSMLKLSGLCHDIWIMEGFLLLFYVFRWIWIVKEDGIAAFWQRKRQLPRF